MRAALFLLVTAAAFAEAPLERHRWADAIERRGTHYIVETNTFPEAADSLLEALESAYPLYEDRFGPLQGRARRPMRIALFRTRDEYMTLGGGVEGAAGHFDSALDRCAIAWRGDEAENGWLIALHEACHHYFFRRHPEMLAPSWYSEGTASFFEGIGAPGMVSRLRAVTARTAMGAGDADLRLLIGTRARVSGNELQLSNFAPARYYALSWSLVHFLATDPGRRDAFRRFEMRLFAARPGDSEREECARTILEEECGDLAALERDWRAHIAALPESEERTRTPVYSWELASASAWTRYCAVRRLRGSAKVPDDLRAGVVSLLDDRDLAVRGAAAIALGGDMGSDAVPGMIAALDAGDIDLKQTALRALATPVAKDAVPRLIGEETERDLAVAALASIGTPETWATLRQALADPSREADARARCAVALGADREAISVLAIAASDAEPEVRVAARASLVRLGRDAEETTSTEIARFEEEGKVIDFFRRALLFHDGSATPGDVTALIAILTNPTTTDTAKARACNMVAAFEAMPAVPALRRLCRPAVSDMVRLEAVRALVHLTGETRGYVPGQSARDREAALRAWAE